MTDITTLIESMTAEQIRAVMASISKQGNVRKVDDRHKLRRIRITSNYHSSCPKPHQVDSFETYTQHSDSIREQVLSGVE